MTGTSQVNKINDLQHNLNPKQSQLRKIKLSRLLLGAVCAISLKSNFNPLTTRRVHWTRRKILSCIILIITYPRQAVLNEFVEYSCCNIYISLG